MGFSLRIFLLDNDDSLWRLAGRKYWEMLEAPGVYPLPRFARQRVRMAKCTVRLEAGVPQRIIQRSYPVVAFDEHGCLDVMQMKIRYAAHVLQDRSPPSVVPAHDQDRTVIDVTDRFLAQGGQWVPPPALAQAIDDAAMGRQRCRRL